MLRRRKRKAAGGDDGSPKVLGAQTARFSAAFVRKWAPLCTRDLCATWVGLDGKSAPSLDAWVAVDPIVRGAIVDAWFERAHLEWLQRSAHFQRKFAAQLERLDRACCPREYLGYDVGYAVGDWDGVRIRTEYLRLRERLFAVRPGDVLAFVSTATLKIEQTTGLSHYVTCEMHYRVIHAEWKDGRPAHVSYLWAQFDDDAPRRVLRVQVRRVRATSAVVRLPDSMHRVPMIDDGTTVATDLALLDRRALPCVLTARAIQQGYTIQWAARAIQQGYAIRWAPTKCTTDEPYKSMVGWVGRELADYQCYHMEFDIDETCDLGIVPHNNACGVGPNYVPARGVHFDDRVQWTHHSRAELDTRYDEALARWLPVRPLARLVADYVDVVPEDRVWAYKVAR